MLNEFSFGLDVVLMGATLLFILKILVGGKQADPKQDGLFRSEKRSLLHQHVVRKACV